VTLDVWQMFGGDTQIGVGSQVHQHCTVLEDTRTRIVAQVIHDIAWCVLTARLDRVGDRLAVSGKPEFHQPTEE